MSAQDILQLEGLAERWSAAASDWDVDALSDLYDDDALLFGGRPNHAVGRPAIRTYFASYGGVILSAALTLFDQEILEIDDRCIFAQGFGNFVFTLAGETRTESRFRTSLLMWRGASGRIRAHHFSSVPDVPPLGD